MTAPGWIIARYFVVADNDVQRRDSSSETLHLPTDRGGHVPHGVPSMSAEKRSIPLYRPFELKLEGMSAVEIPTNLTGKSEVWGMRV
jgi:hypothetical protein